MAEVTRKTIQSYADQLKSALEVKGVRPYHNHSKHGSYYLCFEDINGVVFTVRVSNHEWKPENGKVDYSIVLPEKRGYHTHATIIFSLLEKGDK